MSLQTNLLTSIEFEIDNYCKTRIQYSIFFENKEFKDTLFSVSKLNDGSTIGMVTVKQGIPVPITQRVAREWVESNHEELYAYFLNECPDTRLIASMNER